jgi:diguanylate cyclase (GGDEF)-like protein
MVSALCVGFVPADRRVWPTVLLTTGMFVAGVLATSTARNRQRLIRALVAAASTDWLTDTMTRRGFYERLDHELARARRYGGPVSVILADLDNLKLLNDAGGHEAGDEALREIADALRSAARATDFIGRLGGDEFALLLPGAGTEEAVVVSERLLQAVRAEADSALTASLGVAEWAGPPERGEALLRRADAALYSAKRSGRDRYAVSTPPGPGPHRGRSAATG